MKYDTYKDSGIEWLGEIPEHWENYRLDWIGTIIRGNTGFKKDELLNNGEYVALQYGKTYKVDEVNSDFNYFVNSNFYKESQIVDCGDTILISTSETIEDLGHTCFYNRTDLGLIGGEQILFKPNKKLINEKYLYYYSKIFKSELKRYAKGLKVFRFNSNDLKISIVIPLLKEQTTITNYLDRKTKAIDQKINLLTQKTEKYKELRKAIIKQTVTKGLDKTVQLKDSGIEWIGEIPLHWDLVRIKDIFSISRGRVIAKTELKTDGKFPVYSSQTKNNGVLGYINTFDFDADLLTWTTDGVNAGTVFRRQGKFNCTNICGSLTPIYKKKISLAYFTYSVQESTKHNKRIDTNGAKIMSNEMSVINIVFPPLKEQTAIAHYLDEKTGKIDAIVSNIEKQINTLKELRKTLINDVVTGKIKVINNE
jgi:type I restriction enzyme S subunit